MAWRVEFAPAAERELGNLNPQIGRRILAFLQCRVANSADPRSIGKALKGPRLESFWRYRVGDWRIIASIEDNAVRVLVVRIGNRNDVYRKKS